MKTVLFALNSSYSHTSLAVRAIARGMERHALEYEIIEKNQKEKRGSVLASLAEAEADIYGFSAYIWNIADMRAYAASLKKLLPEAKIVFGGPEVLFAGEAFLCENPAVDHIIRGEGEEAFPVLCEKLAGGEACRRIIDAPPYRDFTESGIYYGETGETPHGLVYYESVRGCPFACTYCLSSVTERSIRAKSAERTLADLRGFEQFDDIKTVKFVDRTFNFDRGRAKAIWRGLCGAEYTKEYHFEICASLLDEESIELLTHAPRGKFRVEVGLQSTNPETLRAIKRTLDVRKTLENTRRIYEAGNVCVHLDLIAGLPYEDYATFGRSFNDAYGLCNELQLGFLKILCGCEMERNAERYGIAYSAEPPYEVLKTNWISFAELRRLKLTDELNDRISNSESFRHTFPWLPLAYGNPFEFFEKFGEFFEAKYGRH
ncbi:MAG: DUF4080 domain-containing protein, partial [Clostridia bacterium]|nr:DUF4080 domain-containing protein [Clostridia bacterium]